MEKQEMMEMMEQFLARIDANTKTMLASMGAHQAQMDAMHEKTMERMDANSKAWREEIRAETEAIRVRTEAMREERMKANMDACMADIKDNREEMTAWGEKLDAWPTDIRDNREETMACQETMEGRLEGKEEPA
jgi:hypothetical protein